MLYLHIRKIQWVTLLSKRCYMNSINDIWDEIIRILSQQLTPTAINTWFSDCTPIELDDSTLVIHTTSDFKRNIITFLECFST